MQAQIEVDAPPKAKNAKAKILVPKFASMVEVLAMDGDDHEDTSGQGHTTLSRESIKARAEELLRDPEARKAFFSGNVER